MEHHSDEDELQRRAVRDRRWKVAVIYAGTHRRGWVLFHPCPEVSGWRKTGMFSSADEAIRHAQGRDRSFRWSFSYR